MGILSCFLPSSSILHPLLYMPSDSIPPTSTPTPTPTMRWLANAVNISSGWPNATVTGQPNGTPLEWRGTFSSLTSDARHPRPAGDPQARCGLQVPAISPELAQCHCVRAPQWYATRTFICILAADITNGLPKSSVLDLYSPLRWTFSVLRLVLDSDPRCVASASLYLGLTQHDDDSSSPMVRRSTRSTRPP